ncbi:MAG TPA: PaeR7I family type II restriction endonuclease, partial [Ktedonobacteraceae bacterium]|nr:PaeR7I family type II restriction endonuclease [Ktedonobacteraceae bacterium]
VAHFWRSGEQAAANQATRGKKDQGNRARATAGTNMDGFVRLIQQIVVANGLSSQSVFIERGSPVTIPGYYRATKMWDVLVIHHAKKSTRLVAALELKSQVGSFGNNFNNRCEEAIGTSVDFWTAFRDGAFGNSPKPFTGYLMLLQDCPAVYAPVRVEEQHFKVFDDFRGSSYARRYELLCQRLVKEGLYDASTLLLSSETDGPQGVYSELESGSGLREWVARLAGHVASVAATL